MSTAVALARIRELTMGTCVSQAISVVANLGVADELAGGPRRVDEIAETVGAHPTTLYRVLRALTAVDVLDELAGRRFALTDVGQLLRSDVPGSLRAWATMVGMPFHRQAWTDLLATVRTGEAAFERVNRRTLFEYLRDDPEAAELFDRAMTATAAQRIPQLVNAYDFGAVDTVMDVGGGHGALLAAILRAHPPVRGVLYDYLDVASRAGRLLADAGVGDRCIVVGGDFLDHVPTGADLYVLARVIPDWDDERAVRILANCRVAMSTGGRLILGDVVFADGVRSPRAKLADLEMLVMTAGGRERDEDEYRDILRQAGLAMSRIIPSGDSCLVEAVPA